MNGMQKSKFIKYTGTVIAIAGVVSFSISLSPIKVEPYENFTEEYEIPEEGEQYLVEIKDFEDLYNFSQLFNKKEQTYYKVSIKNNIVIPNGQGNLSIGTSEKPFRGEFLGNDYKISGVDIYGTEEVTGFFNYIESAKIEKLHVEGSIQSLECRGTGGIAGAAVNSKVDHCSFSGIIEGDGGSVGGIIGNNHSIITNCQSNVKISGGGEGGYGLEGDNFSGNFGSGGIAGNNEGIISFSNNLGEISSDAGGIVGWNNGTISYCINIMDGNGSGIADINTGNIFYCVNTGNMIGNAVAGISLTCTKQGYIGKCINLGIMEGRYAGGLITFLGQDGSMGEGNISDSISVAKRGMKAINSIHTGKAKAIHTISPKLIENEKKEIVTNTKNKNKTDITEIYISLLKNKKTSLMSKSILLFLFGILLWQFEHLRTLYKEKIYQPLKYKQQSDVLRKSIKENKDITLGQIKFENQTIQLSWKILYQEEDRFLLISDENICCLAYNENYQPVYWHESSIFRWLNEEFYETCFTEIERFFLDGDITILDRISAEKLLPLETMRQCRNSKYAHIQGAISKGPYGCWWLKSNIKTDHPSFVTTDGKFSNQGMKNNFDGICVRPVIFIRLGRKYENIN